MGILSEYLTAAPPEKINAAMTAFAANLDVISEEHPAIARSIVKELMDQRSNLKLIASENFCSLATQGAMGNLLVDKYAEGYVGHRFYAGCDNIDDIEKMACDEACRLFGCEHAYVQPHSGADANLVAFWAILRKKIQAPILEELGGKNLLQLSRDEWEDIRAKMGNQKMLGMDLYSGGHLTHGYRHNASAQMFDVHTYTVDKETGLFDYEGVRKMLHEIKPLILLAGFSSFSRSIDYALLREYADEVGAVLVVDMAHFAGLVAGGVLTGRYNPVPYADVITSTTHKTLRGPRGGLVLCKEEYAEYVDKGCPHIIGGPLPHMIAAKAICFKEANSTAFKEYARRIVENSRQLAEAFLEKGLFVQTGGTDNHIVIVNVAKLGLTGRQAESALRECSLTLNRNTVPFDTNGPWYTSGLRFGTAAATTLGMTPEDMLEIADIVANVLHNMKPAFVEKNGETVQSPAKYELDDETKSQATARVRRLLSKHVLYPELDLDFIGQFI
ncbi:MAG: glycine hydroxymethyltransferase [Oscillospiraceae bacterium]|nr:glycine hydroxymethyltransferase [Oscillospiraceae bacterium]